MVPLGGYWQHHCRFFVLHSHAGATTVQRADSLESRPWIYSSTLAHYGIAVNPKEQLTLYCISGGYLLVGAVCASYST